jgi:uncharacterized protein DUF3631/primase-like protein
VAEFLALPCTIFDDVGAQQKRELPWSPDIVDPAITWLSKEDCPLIKLALFGDQPTERGSLRSNKNVIAITGAEGDYDGEVFAIEDAVALFEQSGIEGVFYTSASHTPDKPRWRLLLPFSKDYTGTPAELKAWRTAALKKAESIIGMQFEPESYVLSQSYYVGPVKGADFACYHCEGIPIDMGIDFSTVEVTKPKPAPNQETVATDDAESEAQYFLDHIPPDCDYQTWVAVGMGLKSKFGDGGLALWDAWSAKGDKYDGAQNTAAKWGSFQGDGVTYSTVAGLAQDNGASVDKFNIVSDEDAAMLAEITRLASLPEVKYEQERTAAAGLLAIRASALDKLVKQTRQEIAAAQYSHDEVVTDIEPWDSPVDGNAVALEIVELLRRHTVQPAMGYEAITLWCIGTYVFDGFRIFPRLTLHSPQKRCGKTTTLELIEAIAHRTLISSNVTASVLFRAIDAWKPTVLADEADTWIHNNEELRGIINSGHTRRTARVFRTEEVDGQRIPVSFSTWAPLALAMINTPPDTIMDRSIVLNLRRRTRHEQVHKIPVTLFDEQLDTRRKLARWALDNIDDMRRSQPVMPEIENDRATDNWHSLFAVAQALGGNWPEVVVTTMKILEGAKPDDEDIGIMLLTDIQEVFADWKQDNIFSADLVDALVDMESRPWCEWRRGQPMTKNSLSRLLKPYGIRPNTVRVGHVTQKGYPIKDFSESFSRYIPVATVTSSQASNSAGSGRDASKIENVTVTVEPSHRNTNVTPKTSNGAGCDGVTDEMPKEDF